MSLIWINEGMNGYDVLSVPDCIADDLSKYIHDFYDWLHDKNNDHGYWENVNEEFGSFLGLCYDGATAFPQWLNETVLKDSDEKAYLLPKIEFD